MKDCEEDTDLIECRYCRGKVKAGTIKCWHCGYTTVNLLDLSFIEEMENVSYSINPRKNTILLVSALAIMILPIVVLLFFVHQVSRLPDTLGFIIFIIVIILAIPASIFLLYIYLASYCHGARYVSMILWKVYGINKTLTRFLAFLLFVLFNFDLTKALLGFLSKL